MKRLFGYADRYLQQCTWKDLALVKFCLMSIGLLIGLQIPKTRKKTFAIAAGILFVTTYIPLMTKFFRIVLAKENEEAL